MLAKVAGPFDLIFQDGDKAFYEPALNRLVELLRPGGLLVTDNVLWDGEVVPGFVVPPRRDREDTRAIAAYNERLNMHPQLMTVTLPLRDGVAISLKTPAESRAHAMTVDAWLRAAIADAEERRLPELKPLLEGLALATGALRAANLDPRGWRRSSPSRPACDCTGNAGSAAHPPDGPSR